ncbi:Transposase IS66 family protein [Nitrosomonas eutropha]|uniref:Transposase IS66 family protein n=1 Tax=Nitrosomonas eutropha TaxID=916 RepID=A0A1I7JCC2_9PROT|nr:Transposase IS66 family protein [Nitrosomonas eutropha]
MYLSQFQLLPYEHVCDQFRDQMGIPVSASSLFNFNREAYERLDDFEQGEKAQLAMAAVAHADETGINIDGRRR